MHQPCVLQSCCRKNTVYYVPDGGKHTVICIPAYTFQKAVVLEHLAHEVTHHLLFVVAAFPVIAGVTVELLRFVNTALEFLFTDHFFRECKNGIVVLHILSNLVHAFMSEHSGKRILCVKGNMYGLRLRVEQAVLVHRIVPFNPVTEFLRNALHHATLLRRNIPRNLLLLIIFLSAVP